MGNLLLSSSLVMSRNPQRAYVDVLHNLRSEGILRTEAVFNSFMRINRSNYSPTTEITATSPFPIGHGQTISALDIQAMAGESLYPAVSKPSSRVLDVGCGSGFMTALFARMNPSATVVGIDCVPELVHLSETNIRKQEFIIIIQVKIQG